MFGIIKFIIWIVGLVVIVHFAMGYFGYAFNWEYFSDSRAKCEARIKICREDFFAKGYENPDCQIKDCIQENIDKSKIIIKK